MEAAGLPFPKSVDGQNKRHSAAYHFCIHLMMLKRLHNIPPNILKCLETGLSIMTGGLPAPAILFLADGTKSPLKMMFGNYIT
jgi:hypothetical protein